MKEKDIISMSIKELRRLQVINKVLGKRLKQPEASRLLNLSDRQVRRIVKAVKRDGEAGVIHKKRGKPSNRLLPASLKETVLELYKINYFDFGPTLATEKLKELHNITIGRETLRGWLIEADLWKKKRKTKEHRRWRERKEHFGEMVLLDGSEHDWLEGRGSKMTLMGYIDDATNTCYGRFYDYEGTIPAMDSLKEYIKKYGIPMKIYLDKHSTYLVNRKLRIEEELKGIKKSLTQFERACKELGIEVIHANSPQAKGRVERLFGTLQDRLIKEMRLANVSNKEQANDLLDNYLPKYIEKFSVKPAKKDNLHIKVPAHINLDQILSVKKKRCLRNDNTISFKGNLYLIEEKLKTKTIIVEVRTDGSLHLSDKGQYLSYRQVEPQPKANLAKPVTQRTRKPYIPLDDHPWRKLSLNNKKHNQKKEVSCLTKTGHF